MELSNPSIMSQAIMPLLSSKSQFFSLSRGKTPGLPFEGLMPKSFSISGAGAPGMNKLGSASYDDEKLKEALNSFEAVLFNFLLTEMKKTVKKSGFFGGNSFASESYGSMFDSEIAISIAQSGALGLSESMYNQLTNTFPYIKQENINGK